MQQNNKPMSTIFANFVPWRVTFEITNACQCNCIHCLHDNHKKDKYEMSYDEIIRIIHGLKKLGVMQITLTGGEPTLRPDIAEIIRYAVNLDLSVQLLTNGCIRESVIQELQTIRSKLKIAVSIHGIGEINDHIFGYKGAFDQAVATVKLLKEGGNKVSINTVVMSRNLHNLRELEEFVAELGVEWSHSPMIWGNGVNELRLSDEQLKQYYCAYPGEMKIMDRYLQSPTRAKVEFDRRCNAGYITMAIDPKGNVFPCSWVRIPLGNAVDTPIESIWQEGLPLQEFRTTGCGSEGCASCEYMGICKRCPGYALVETGDLDAIPREWCRTMNAQRKALNEYCNC